MLVINAAPVAFTALLLTTTASTAPTRTRKHCRCTFVSDAPERTNWEPSSLDQSSPWEPTPLVDMCAELGPELENFRHAKPDLYDSYIRQSIPGAGSSSTPSESLHPLPTTVLLDAAAHNGFQRSQKDQVHEPRPTSRPNQRIVCHSELETVASGYESSCLNLWILQFIIAVCVFACVAEGIQLGMRWMNRRHYEDIEQDPKPSPLRLLGDEQRLLAVPDTLDAMPSPGVEKKLRAYERASYCPPQQAPQSKREFIAYDDNDDDDDDDDEFNRPVM